LVRWVTYALCISRSSHGFPTRGRFMWSQEPQPWGVSCMLLRYDGVLLALLIGLVLSISSQELAGWATSHANLWRLLLRTAYLLLSSTPDMFFDHCFLCQLFVDQDSRAMTAQFLSLLKTIIISYHGSYTECSCANVTPSH